MKKSLSIIAIIFVLGSCTSKSDWVKNFNSGSALGTSYHITYISKDKLDYQREIDSVFKVINRSMSTYMPTSDISKINKGDTAVVVDHMFRDVFELSKEIHDRTKGYFDPTVGSLVNAWGFGPGKQIPLDSLKVDSILQYVGFEKVGITANNRINKANANIYFDFNAIAKGYAIDRLALMLEKHGITDYLVEVGGEIVAKGKNKVKEKQWVVGIDNPAGDDQPKILINLKNTALASSGNYRKFRIDSITGNKFVHTIDPKTGYTKNSNILAASVLANTCAKADGYATGLMAMDLEDSKRVLENDANLEAYIIYLDDKGNPQSYVTKGFKGLLLE
ncbi:FAD:protein FMN transferase [Flavobacteriaceae bacterium KMM 6897]|nr:FAD:protein FMN transferase [Flavobacteriaceae bacterium KMM 6897]MEB8345053.1 FAD:protein FMN transferase [Flavobacteriaceae bacterium KMM 6898]